MHRSFTLRLQCLCLNRIVEDFIFGSQSPTGLTGTNTPSRYGVENSAVIVASISSSCLGNGLFSASSNLFDSSRAGT